MTMVIVYDNLRGGNTISKIEFYQKENGTIPVCEFLKEVPPKMRAKAIRDIEILEQFGKDLREPYVKPIKGNDGLYELHIKFACDIARIFYFTYRDNRFILLHGFIKKTMKTPKNEIDRAVRYMEDYLRRVSHD